MMLFNAHLHYYIREKFWRSAITLCSDELKKGRDPYINFWRGLSYFMEGSIIDAIRDTEPLLNNRDLKFSAVNALIHYHNNYSIADNDKLTRLLEISYDNQNTCSASDLINCSRFYFYINDFDKYDEMIQMLNEMHVDSGDDLIVKGWRMCFSTDPEQTKEGQKLFQLYVERYGANNIDALMGGFKCLERLKENEEVLDSFLEVSHLFNTFTPLQIEKCRIFMNNSDYENAMDYINGKVTIKHFEILKILAVCNLINDGDYYTAVTNIDRMWEQLLTQEPKNPELYFNCAQLFSRICEKRLSIIKKCEVMIDKALEFSPKNSKYLVEKAYYRLYHGEIDKAANILRQTAEVDANNRDTSIATIYCKILQKKYKEALDDIHFLKDIFIHPKILYFEAFVRQKLGDKEESVSLTVLEALNTHIKLAKQSYLSKFDILIATEFDFLFEMTKLLLAYHSIQSNSYINLSNIPQNVIKAQKILELIIKNKYFTSALLLYAKLKFLMNDKNFATTAVQNILQIDQYNIDAYTLYALILIEENDYVKAREIIKEAMINNLVQSREHGYFQIVKTKCEVYLSDTESASKTINESLKLIDKLILDDDSGVKSSIFQVKPKDKIDLLRMNIEILLKSGKIQEAQASINKLIGDLQDSDMEDEILILNSELALKEENLKKAVNLLKRISTKNENIYRQSRIKLADIYLSHLKERRLYTWCYIELLENFYNFENLKLAGDSLIKIDSPDEAVIYYSKALKEKKEPIVERDLGRALIRTHDYKKALSYYLESLGEMGSNLNNSNIVTYYEIATDFVVIMLKLAANDINKNNSIKIHLENFIEKITEDMKTFDDHIIKQKASMFKFMLAKVLKNIYHENKSVDTSAIYKLLEEALKLSKEVINKFRDLRNELGMKQEKEFLSEICYEIGNYYEVIDPQFEFAEKAYIESLNNNSNYEKALYSVSNLHVKNQNFNGAHKYVDILLRLNESNEDAIQLLITIINSKKSNEYTINYLETILEKQPLSFKLIEIYIDVVRRVGKIHKSKDILSKCDKKLKYTYSPGLNFCKGLYYRYTGEINKALQEFSKSKTDENYGAKCLEQMLEIYINPDNDILLIYLDSPLDNQKYSDSSINSNENALINYKTTELNMQAIYFLLKELKMRRNDEKTQIYEAYVTILTKQKPLINNIIGNLQDILKKNQENVAAWVALAMANLITLRINEAKTNLKIIEKSALNMKYYNEYERGLLLNAYIMIMSDNPKKAEETLMKLCSDVNQSQIKAYDLLGMIKEKNKSYVEACAFYEKAWEFSNKTSANIGYKLAACYINNKNSVKAINICNEIKKKYRDYPIDDLAIMAKQSLK